MSKGKKSGTGEVPAAAAALPVRYFDIGQETIADYELGLSRGGSDPVADAALEMSASEFGRRCRLGGANATPAQRTSRICQMIADGDKGGHQSRQYITPDCHAKRGRTRILRVLKTALCIHGSRNAQKEPANRAGIRSQQEQRAAAAAESVRSESEGMLSPPADTPPGKGAGGGGGYGHTHKPGSEIDGLTPELKALLDKTLPDYATRRIGGMQNLTKSDLVIGQLKMEQLIQRGKLCDFDTMVQGMVQLHRELISQVNARYHRLADSFMALPPKKKSSRPAIMNALRETDYRWQTEVANRLEAFPFSGLRSSTNPQFVPTTLGAPPATEKTGV